MGRSRARCGSSLIRAPNKTVTISRAQGAPTFPASFMLIGDA